MIDTIISSLQSTIQAWPQWATKLILLMTLLLSFSFLTQIFLTFFESKNDREVDNLNNLTKPTWSFRFFQLQYLSVYLIIMLADWLQGTNMYTLYSSYGVDAGQLFLIGFLSAAISGPFLGPLVDKLGRKFACIAFCLLEVLINTMEHYPSFFLLSIGRVLGGISTCLLFTAFESWMVSHHRKMKFPEEWLDSTFSVASAGSGVTAILAGIIAQVAADKKGDIGPFQVAIALTVVTLVLILFWEENYGKQEQKEEKKKEKKEELSLLSESLQTFQYIINNPVILAVGLSQACFEGAMYTFVFIWVPTLIITYNEYSENLANASLPTGLVFTSFMLAMTLGGILMNICYYFIDSSNQQGNKKKNSLKNIIFSYEFLLLFIYSASLVSFLVPLYYNFSSFLLLLFVFLIFELFVGMFQACGASLRAKYYPTENQSTILSFFRLFLNIIVVIGTRISKSLEIGTNMEENKQKFKLIFSTIVFILFLATSLQFFVLTKSLKNKSKNKSE